MVSLAWERRGGGHDAYCASVAGPLPEGVEPAGPKTLAARRLLTRSSTVGAQVDCRILLVDGLARVQADGLADASRGRQRGLTRRRHLDQQYRGVIASVSVYECLCMSVCSRCMSVWFKGGGCGVEGGMTWGYRVCCLLSHLVMVGCRRQWVRTDCQRHFTPNETARYVPRLLTSARA